MICGNLYTVEGLTQEKNTFTEMNSQLLDKSDKMGLQMLEKKIEQIESDISSLKQRLEMESELELLQKIFLEIEVRESERDQLYALLDDVV